MVGSNPLSAQCLHVCQDRTTLKAILAGQKRTSTLDLVPALAALNKSTHYECEIRSWYDDKQMLKISKTYFK